MSDKEAPTPETPEEQPASPPPIPDPPPPIENRIYFEASYSGDEDIKLVQDRDSHVDLSEKKE